MVSGSYVSSKQTCRPANNSPSNSWRNPASPRKTWPPQQSPEGYGLLYILMKTVGKGNYVKGATAPILDPVTKAHRMLTDSTHPDYHIVQAPHFHEINRLVGLPK